MRTPTRTLTLREAAVGAGQQSLRPPERVAAVTVPLLHVERLSKHYGRVRALDGVNLAVPAGSIYGFVGPNGAGKTTLMRILAGLSRPTRGRVRLDGRNLLGDRARSAVGFRALVEVPAFHGHMDGRANLARFADMAGVSRADVDPMMEAMGLAHAARRPVRGYSLGMRQRLGIAQTLLGGPRLVVLDEPMNGLDPAAIHLVRQLIRRWRDERGVTFLLSSHLLRDIEDLCDEAAVLHEGTIRAAAPLDTLMGTATPGYLLQTTDQAHALRVIETQVPEANVRMEGPYLRIEGEGDVLTCVQQVLLGVPLLVTHLARAKTSLEDVFLDLTEGVMG